MSTKGKRVIYVGPADGSDSKPLTMEGIAVAATAPGTVLKQTASGFEASDIAATQFGEQLIIADKDQQRSVSIDTSWTINENMAAIAPRSGEFMNILVATGQTLIRGDALSRNGAGLLKKAVTPATVDVTSEEVVAFAEEAVTTSGTTLVTCRIA